MFEVAGRVKGYNMQVCSFQVNPEYLGLLIGAKGCNIKNAQSISGFWMFPVKILL